MTYLLFIVGFYLLIQGAEWLIKGASQLAKLLGVSPLVIGLTIVAFGTSLPELVVNLFANSGEGSGDLALGNVLGSNIANILLILGITAIIRPLSIRRTTVYREVVFNIMASVMLAVLVADTFFVDDGGFIGLDKIDGIVLISYFIIFLYYNFGRKQTTKEDAKEAKKLKISMPNLFLLIAGGVIGLALGGRWIVDGAIAISELAGLSEGLVGLTVVAIGTSLPELATSVIAARKGDVDIAVGNAIGSNLFNIMWVLGLSAILNPISVSNEFMAEIAIVIAVAVLLFSLTTFGKYKHQISKGEGYLFLMLYFVYLGYTIIQG